MKKAVFVLVVLIFLGVGTYFFFGPEFRLTNSAFPPSPSHTKVPENSSFCRPSDLKAFIELEGAAENIYGTLSLQNISTKNCTIVGSNFVDAITSAQNVTTKHVGGAGPATFALTPSETVYSQVHFPNGPQCGGITKASTVTFSYNISPQASVTFQDLMSKSAQVLTICTDTSQNTQIDLRSLSSQPVN